MPCRDIDDFLVTAHRGLQSRMFGSHIVHAVLPRSTLEWYKTYAATPTCGQSSDMLKSLRKASVCVDFPKHQTLGLARTCVIHHTAADSNTSRMYAWARLFVNIVMIMWFLMLFLSRLHLLWGADLIPSLESAGYSFRAC